MPRLNEYVSIGFCTGYGDGDYRVSTAVGELSPEKMNELRATAVMALYLMEDMWRKANPPEVGQQASADPKAKP